jgi:hypothetical protein
MVFGDACRHPDSNQDCGSAHMSFPNSHTTVYRIRPAEIGNPASFYWQAWVLYPGDQFKDIAPNGRIGSDGRPSCWVKQQLRAQPATAYGWGRDPCSQKLVGTAR